MDASDAELLSLRLAPELYQPETEWMKRIGIE